MKKTMMMAVAVLALGGMAACEKAGEDMDNAIDDMRGQPRDLSDGAMEKTGEAIDNAAGVARDGVESVGDAIGDAVDGDPNTKPN